MTTALRWSLFFGAYVGGCVAILVLMMRGHEWALWLTPVPFLFCFVVIFGLMHRQNPCRVRRGTAVAVEELPPEDATWPLRMLMFRCMLGASLSRTLFFAVLGVFDLCDPDDSDDPPDPGWQI